MADQSAPAPEPSINNLQAGLLITTSVVFYIIRFLLDITVLLAGATILLGPLEWFIIGIWLKLLLPSDFFDTNAGRKIVTLMAGLVVDTIPFINIIPATIASVIRIIIESRIDDAARAAKTAPKGGQVRNERATAIRIARERMRAKRAAEQDATHGAANDNQQESFQEAA